MHKNIPLGVAVALGLAGMGKGLAQTTDAAETVATETATTASSGQQLDTVEVTAKAERPDVQQINAADIQKMPTRNGGITDLLRNNPNVQLSDTADSGLTAGEITPERISFHGEKFYNNRFLLDGLSNNDILNPGSSISDITNSVNEANPQTTRIVPGHPEAFHVNAELLDEVTVYDSNVPAQYGGFSGGVVDAKLKNPDLKRASGRVGLRTTRDSWTRFLFDEGETIGDDDADNPNQPSFTKKIYDIALNQPINERLGLRLAYNRTESSIPEVHPGLGNMRYTEERRAETLMLKGLYQHDGRNRFTATLMTSPHSGSYWYNNTKNGEYEIEGGGWRGNLEWFSQQDWGRVTSMLSFARNTNRIDYKGGADFWSWNVSNDAVASQFDWCSRPIGNVTSMKDCTWAYEGGIGELENQSEIWTLKQDYALNAFQSGRAEHHIALGWEVELGEASAHRPVTTNLYTATRTTTSTDCLYCVPGVIYAVNNAVYPSHQTKVDNNHYAFYLQDRIRVGRLELTPGLRVDHDDFLSDTTLSPRLAFNFDVYGNRQTQVFAGLNRYHAGSMLAYALRRNMPQNLLYSGRAPGQEWSELTPRIASNSPNWDVLELKTPYSDEFNMGLAQNWGNALWTLKWVHRQSRDQFTMREYEDAEGYSYSYMSNEGRGQANTVTMGISSLQARQVGDVAIGYSFGARYSSNKSSFNNYEESIYEASDLFRYLYEGQIYDHKGQIPPFDHNTPWTSFLEISTDVPKWRLNWTHRFNYTDRYSSHVQTFFTSCQNSTQPDACGDYTGRVYDFVQRDYKRALTLDWRINWQVPVHGNQYLDLTLDVLNVFNSKVGGLAGYSQNGTNSTVSGYKTGRQFWLGAAYRW